MNKAKKSYVIKDECKNIVQISNKGTLLDSGFYLKLLQIEETISLMTFT